MTTDIKELVKRLRAMLPQSVGPKAADALEAMGDTLDAIVAERDRLLDAASDRIMAIAAERDRLKAALEEIKRLSRLEDGVRMSAINQLADKALRGDA